MGKRLDIDSSHEEGVIKALQKIEDGTGAEAAQASGRWKRGRPQKE